MFFLFFFADWRPIVPRLSELAKQETILLDVDFKVSVCGYRLWDHSENFRLRNVSPGDAFSALIYVI